MATASSSASTVVSAGVWLGTSNVFASDNVFATDTGAVQNVEYPMDVGGFDFSSIPAGSVLTSVTVGIENKCNWANRSRIKGEMYDGTTKVTGPTLDLPISVVSERVSTFIPTPTLAQLKSANLFVRVTHTRTNVNPSTLSVDWVKIDVVYTAPATGGRPKVWTGGSWVSKPAKVFTGAAWAEKPVKVWTGATWKTVT